MNAMLHDFSGGNYNFYDTTSSSNIKEAPNDDAKDLYKMIFDNGVPIYPGNTTYTRKSFTAKLLEFKNAFNYSDKTFNNLIKLIMDVLPKKHTLPESYYEMKKIMKSLRAEYEKIDVCKNDCMIFYGNDKDKVVCYICGKNHFQDKSRENGKKIFKKIP